MTQPAAAGTAAVPTVARLRIVAGGEPDDTVDPDVLTLRIGPAASPALAASPAAALAASPVPAESPAPGRALAVDVLAESPSWVRSVIGSAVPSIVTREVTVAVRHWRAPLAGWTGRLGPLPGLVRQELDYPADGSGRVRARLTLSADAPLRTMLLAVLPALSPTPHLPRTTSPDVTLDGTAPDWLVGHPHLSWRQDRVVGRPEIRDHDLLLSSAPHPPAAALTQGRLVAGGALLQTADRAPELLIDTSVANPCGRLTSHGPAGVPARLTLPGAGRWLALTEEDHGLLTGGWLGEPLREAQKEALAGVGLLRWDDPPESADPAGLAGLLVQLAATGLICVPGRLPDAAIGLLARELRDRLAEPLPSPADDPLAWEVRSIRQRRAALRGHGRTLRLGGPPSVSALLVTSRPAFLGHALAQVDRLSYPNLELVLGWHADSAPDPDVTAGVRDSSIPVTLVHIPSSLSFGEALGMAAARSSGSVVSKVDDDDRYGPEHVWDLVLALEHSGAALVGKPAEFVYLEELDTTVRRGGFAGDRYHTVVAGGTVTMARGDLERVGGWRPLMTAEDKGLQERVTAAGGLIYRTHGVGYLYFRRSTSGHTWDSGVGYFLRKSGPQWRGLLRHEEFGTAAADG